MNALSVSHPHYPSPHANTLASLVKGRWIDGKAQTVALLRLLATRPPFLFIKLFCRQDGGIATPPTIAPHQPSQNRTIPLAFRNAIICVLVALSHSLFVGEELAPPVALNLAIPTALLKALPLLAPHYPLPYPHTKVPKYTDI